MKRSLNILTILFVLCAGLLFFFLFRSSETASASVSAFRGFPLNETRPISFDVNHEALEDKTRREKLDQMRDWLLYAVVSDSGKSTRELGEILYDLPATRNGYMHPVGNFEFGVTRSRMISEGEVVALVPGDNTAERIDQLAHIADEHRKNSGELPKSILVFDYKLNLDGEQSIPAGEITRRETIDGKELFTPKYGYHERTIKSLEDLKQFMAQIDDVVFAQQDGGALKLGGRKILGRSYGGIAVEDVAALWQSEENLSSELPGSGFSLDPAYDFAKVKSFFENTLIPISEMFSSYDSGFDENFLQKLPYGLRSHYRTKIPPTVLEVSQGLDRCDMGPLFAWIEDLRQTSPQAIDFVQVRIPASHGAPPKAVEEMIAAAFGFQKARYDGNLQGTQVGMVLFYTDLLAKLWDFDYKQSAPREIEDFKSELEIRAQFSPVFNKQIEEMPWARLWFGPDSRGYEAVEKSLLFTRRATRLFAKSSTSVTAKSEAEPDAATASFINWWDDHFEEVARYEPQYERLNQIMKWSILITWLRQAQESPQLQFLKDPNLVNRKHHFPTWVRQQPDLRFNQWSDAMFRPSDKCITTEALPFLYSEPYARSGDKRAQWFLYGGVSLSHKTQFAERTFLSAETKVASLARRSGVDYAPYKSTENVVQIIGGPKYELTTLASNRLSITSMPRSQAILRNRYGDLASGKFEQVIANESKAFQIATKYGDAGVGNLSIARKGNGFRIGWESREVDLSQSLARKLSTSQAPDELLASHPRIETAIKLPGKDNYLLKMKNSERWTRIQAERTPSVEIDAGWQARVAEPQSSSKSLTVAWWDQAKVNAELGEAQYLVVSSQQTAAARLAQITADLPSPAGRPVTLVYGEHRIKAVVDPASGSLHVRYRDLPEAIQKNPGQLQRAISRTDAAQLQRNSVLHVPDGRGPNTALVHELQSKNFSTLSKELSSSPRDFKLQLENHLHDALKQSDDLLATRDYAALQNKLDDLIEVFGPRPDLTIRKGIAQIRNGQTLSGVKTFNESVIHHQVAQRQLFFDEINFRLRSTSSTGEPLVQFVDEGQGIATHCRVRKLPEGAKAGAEGANLDSAVLYIEDTPRLRNLDWQTNPQASLKEVISGEFGEVIKLPRGDLSNFRPTRIYVEDARQTFNPIRTRTTRFNFRHPTTLNPNPRCEDENESTNRCGDVYLIRARERN